MLTLSGFDYGFRGAGVSTELGNVIHTRQNLIWYPLQSITGVAEVKSRHFLGENITSTVEYNEVRVSRTTYFDWTWILAEGDNLSIVTTLDRAYFDCYLGPTQITLGRQRIAWGTNWVWNPIDLFNPVSPLDFDTEERPGADAARIQFYTSATSKLELAIAPNRDTEQRVIAGLAKANIWTYDFHLIAGSERSSAVIGGAWAGQIRDAGFRGEYLYADPGEASDYAGPFTVPAASIAYTFPNSFFVHGGVLYNSAGTTEDAGGERLLQAIRRNELSPARASVFGEVAYNLSPLVRGNLSGILNPFDHSWYLGPALNWSVAANIDFSATALLFGGRGGTEFGDMNAILVTSLKLSF